jgi:DMSO/TMAO reductase YedYZ molybdopterin-dependent catalytic subunit
MNMGSMKAHSLTRRDLLRGSAALAALALARHPLSAFGFPDPEDGATVLPFLDKQTGKNGIQWEKLSSWITPNPDVYVVKHYNQPEIDPSKWQLELGGLVKKAAKFTLAELKSRRRKTVTATLECSGNNASAGFMGAVANARWTGTPLAPLLREAEPYKRGIEVGFFGTDGGKEEDRNKKEYAANFSRGLHVVDAMRDDILLCYEMNGEPLTPAHGAPVRLVVPGWFGIAWVKWLQRVEVLDRRVMSKYMAREYVTVRGEERGEKTAWRETSIGPMLVKSMIGRAEKLHDGTVRLRGAAWSDGTPLEKVELKVDDGPWQPVTLDKSPRSKFSWTFWSFDWRKPAPGEHRLVSRATDAEGRAQPSAEDAVIKLKRTYWEANQQWPRRIQIDS